MMRSVGYPQSIDLTCITLVLIELEPNRNRRLIGPQHWLLTLLLTLSLLLFVHACLPAQRPSRSCCCLPDCQPAAAALSSSVCTIA